MRLDSTIDEVRRLDARDRDAMFALMTRHFAGVRREAFEADLREKSWILRLVDAQSGALRGFSTQQLLSTHVAGREVLALFSGDTIVDREFWGTTALALAWGRLAFHVMERHPTEPLYWFLISQGYRTYRFLPVFFRVFYPRFDAPTPDEEQAILDAVAQQKFNHAYDRATGIVRGSAEGYRLREGVADVTEGRLSDPHVRYFVTRNPNHRQGDELCCLAPLTRENFSPVARRLIASPRFASPTF